MQLAAALFGRERQSGTISRVTATATADSEDGTAVVEFEDGNELELNVTGAVYEGDTVVVDVQDGSPIGAGSIGWGDRIYTDVNGVKTLIRETTEGVLVAKVGSDTGALVSSDSAFKVVALTWSGNTPTIGDAIALFDADSVDLLGGDVFLQTNPDNPIAQYELAGVAGGIVTGQATIIGASETGIIYEDNYTTDQNPETGDWEITGGSSSIQLRADEILFNGDPSFCRICAYTRSSSSNWTTTTTSGTGAKVTGIDTATGDPDVATLSNSAITLKRRGRYMFVMYCGCYGTGTSGTNHRHVAYIMKNGASIGQSINAWWGTGSQGGSITAFAGGIYNEGDVITANYRPSESGGGIYANNFRLIAVYLGGATTTRADADTYTGSYRVTPMASTAQTLWTDDLLMTDDVTVEEIPYSAVDNESGGQTATIGE
jgi:hypothetical protein